MFTARLHEALGKVFRVFVCMAFSKKERDTLNDSLDASSTKI